MAEKKVDKITVFENADGFTINYNFDQKAGFEFDEKIAKAAGIAVTTSTDRGITQFKMPKEAANKFLAQMEKETETPFFFQNQDNKVVAAGEMAIKAGITVGADLSPQKEAPVVDTSPVVAPAHKSEELTPLAKLVQTAAGSDKVLSRAELDGLLAQTEVLKKAGVTHIEAAVIKGEKYDMLTIGDPTTRNKERVDLKGAGITMSNEFELNSTTYVLPKGQEKGGQSR